jgi:hypothetical protein
MEAAITALLARPSIEDAARVAGVAEKTLRRWMRETAIHCRVSSGPQGRRQSGDRAASAGHGRRCDNDAKADDGRERASRGAA